MTGQRCVTFDCEQMATRRVTWDGGHGDYCDGCARRLWLSGDECDPRSISLRSLLSGIDGGAHDPCARWSTGSRRGWCIR